MKKKESRSKSGKSVRDLRAKALNPKAAGTVQGGSKRKGGGDEIPVESLSFNFTKIEY